jgi:hypothetical protein
MSIFKTIGNKLKRVVSINNIKRAVTGNFSAIGADVIRVATTLSPSEQRAKDAGQTVDATTFNVAPLSADLASFVDDVGSNTSNKLANSLSKLKPVKDISSLATSVYLKAMWEKYRNWIIGFFVSLILFIVGWKILKKGKNVSRARTR